MVEGEGLRAASSSGIETGWILKERELASEEAADMKGECGIDGSVSKEERSVTQDTLLSLAGVSSYCVRWC